MDLLTTKQSRLPLLLCAILLLLFINAHMLFRYFKSVSEQESWVTHTMEVMNEVEQILSAVKDAETGIRGFLLTRQEEYLQPYNQGSTQVWIHFNRVRVITKDNLAQQLALNTLEQSLKNRLQILDRILETDRKTPGQISKTTLLFSEGKVAMDRIREQVAQMQSLEQNLLNQRAISVEESKSYFFWILLLTTLLSAIVIIMAFLRIARSQRQAEEENRLKALEAKESDILAELARNMAGDISLEIASERVLDFLSNRFGVLAGRLFMSEKRGLRLISSLAVKDTDFSVGEFLKPSSNHGLISVAWNQGVPKQVSDVPEHYWHISSSLGEAQPRHLLFLPFAFQGKLIGLLELAFFENISSENYSTLKKLSDTLGVGLNAAQSREQLQLLLERTQQQSEELQTQQEELKTNNEELEQQARALESQQQSLQAKNRELEMIQSDLKLKALDLEKSSQYKSEFLAKMSHELRTPLNGLLILSTLLIENKEKNLTSQQVQFARSIQNAGNDLLMLINDILDLSKIEARKLTIRKETFTVQDFFNSKRLTFEPQTKSKGLALKFDLPDDIKKMELKTDRQRLEQILRNFLSNAIKFTDDGEITLRARTDSSRKNITFTVCDTGIGIAKEKLDSIFLAFEQADSSISRKYGGTGLGLTISKELAAFLGGEIKVESEFGVGSQFHLTIPFEIPQQLDSKTPVAATSFAKFNEQAATDLNSRKSHQNHRITNNESLKNINPDTKSILIVEDDAAFRASVVEAVRSYGFAPVEASDGDEALAILNTHTPSAVLLDIKLPGISGLGILEMMKQLPHLRHIPVHMISALEYQQNALRMGALGYLTKPVTIEKVRAALSRIENLLSKRLKRVLLIEDDERQSSAVSQLIAGDDIEVSSVKTGREAVSRLREQGFDCIILDLTLPDVSGFDLLEELSSLDVSLPPIVIYTGKDLSDEEEAYLRRYSESIIIKGVRSPERLLDEVNLFLHRIESLLPVEKREMLSTLRSQEKSFEGKTVLVVDDDIRNIFALTSALETRGLKVLVARDGVEALETLNREPAIDLVIMDIMMPRMDGYEAIRKIRIKEGHHWKTLPIVALTAKAMKEDHEKCMDAGASDYLPKPVNLDNLTTVLKVWLAPKGFFG